jgi:Amt family ammonium transporter
MVFAHAGLRGRRASVAAANHQRDQHGVDAGRSLPGVLHAGGFRNAGAGFARSRETVNILVEGIADTCICGITFWLWGFAFMFEPGTPWIGTTGFMLHGLPATYGTTGVPLLAYWVFQYAFADTCSTVTSGAMIGRCGFIGDLLYSVGVTGFIYPIIGHWAWGPDGWLAVMGPVSFHDFAGSTVVHTIGGVISLAGAIALGPRLGRVFKRDGGQPMKPHDLIIGATGGLILWFGWYGFTPEAPCQRSTRWASAASPSTPPWRRARPVSPRS